MKILQWDNNIKSFQRIKKSAKTTQWGKKESFQQQQQKCAGRLVYLQVKEWIQTPSSQYVQKLTYMGQRPKCNS